MYAGWKGQDKVVRELLSLGADPNQMLNSSSKAHDSCYPLLAALER
jgi:hypothetical protein